MTDDKTPQDNGAVSDSIQRSDNPPAAKKRRRRRPRAHHLKKLRVERNQSDQALKADEIKPEKRIEKDWLPSPPFSRRYAAIDLGTNNCRLLIAVPQKDGFRVVDAFSRIVRLGEGVSQTGMLSDAAMDRTIEALTICREKIESRRVTAIRCIATQACRGAGNGGAFLERIKKETNLDFELITTEQEAALAVRGCMDLTDPKADAALVFDIGGGSTEISWVVKKSGDDITNAVFKLEAWTSIPIGVVTASERFGGAHLTREEYENTVDTIALEVTRFTGADHLKPLFESGRGHLLGTSGTVTSLAGVHLGLKKYIRKEVDGIWLASERALSISEKLRAMGFDARQKEPCIGPERADLVVPGCAILEGILKAWPASRIRVADRGLREGILAELIASDRHRKRRRRRSRGRSADDQARGNQPAKE
ncbi:Ppx/GppA phosphatase family protein [Aquisalinus flavus]|uniref:Ppx/GppA phosphatase family protein n=1 Tax=Aquisalinus flavus TaxID=1526572 RepID=UPI001F4D0951|nr:Ppx/GppA phosphatase family protein [Aquisalinus flavus]